MDYGRTLRRGAVEVGAVSRLETALLCLPMMLVWELSTLLVSLVLDVACQYATVCASMRMLSLATLRSLLE